jgi:hypothetical protein
VSAKLAAALPLARGEHLPAASLVGHATFRHPASYLTKARHGKAAGATDSFDHDRIGHTPCVLRHAEVPFTGTKIELLSTFRSSRTSNCFGSKLPFTSAGRHAWEAARMAFPVFRRVAAAGLAFLAVGLFNHDSTCAKSGCTRRWRCHRCRISKLALSLQQGNREGARGSDRHSQW